MLTNYSAILTLILGVIFALICLSAETAPSNINNVNDFYRYPVLYRRFIRRKPPIYPDDMYMEEIVEIFDTKEKPPAYGTLMTDEDIDQFIFCDFNRHLDKCKQYWKFRNQLLNPFLSRTTTPKTTITTSSSTEEATAAITTQPPKIATESSKIPHLNEEDYTYSDEILEVGKNKQKNINNEYYYDEENDSY